MIRAELNDYSEVTLTERFKKLRPPQLWRARVPLLPKIAALILIQILAFVLVFCWLNYRQHHRHSSTNSLPPTQLSNTRQP